MTPSPSPSVDYSVLIHNFLETYTPSPDDSQFVLDLLHSLENHEPLTLLEKFFIFAVTLPGPLSWKIDFFTWLSTLSMPSLFWPLVGAAALFVVIYLFRIVMRNRFLRQNPPVFLELTFPSITNKSAHATEQLFTLLHSLAGQRTFLQRLVGYTKRFSLEIVASREQGIRYILVISKNDAPTIQRSLLAYLPSLKIQQIGEYLHDTHASRPKIVELALGNDFVLPLHDQKALTEHDPIAYLTGNMTKLQTDELMVFQVVVTPVTRATHGRILKRIDKILNRLYRNQPLAEDVLATPLQRVLGFIWNSSMFLLKAIVGTIDFVLSLIVPGKNWEPSKPDPASPAINNPIEEQLRTEIKQKIDGQLFESSVRLLVHSDEPTTSQERIAGFLATFAPLDSTYQFLERKTGLALIDLQSRLTRFHRRRLSWLKNPILSSSELTDIYHFPYTDTTKTEDLRKVRSPALPAPLSFKQGESKFDNVFATNSYGGSDTPIGLTLDERRRHAYIIGATGSGKTTLLSTMIYQDILNGKSVGVIDPHGQLIEQLLRVIPEERVKDVVWFAPDDDEFPVAINLLEMPASEGLSRSQLEKHKSLVSSSLLSVFQKFYDPKFFGPRMEYILRNTILTALETPNPTLLTILDLLTKTGYRKQVVQTLQNNVLKDFWIHEFEKYGQLQKNAMTSPITNKVGGLLSSPINYAILSQPKSTIDFAEVMNSGKILLCDLSKGKIGEDASSFFGSLLLTKLQLAALSRARIPEADRKNFYLYVDEFQNFATPTFGELVSEARKYRVATILAHQSISQIEDRDLVKIILANVGTVICFRTANPEDERFILPIFQPEVAKHEISNLPLYTFYMKVAVGQAEDTFMAVANNFTTEGSDDTAQAAIDASRAQYATTITQSSEISPEAHSAQLELVPIIEKSPATPHGKRRI